MLFFLEAVNVVAVILMLFMLAVIIREQPSKSQTAFILYNIFTMLFVIGVHLELLYSNTTGEALAGLCVQYIGQAGFLMALLWFVAEFARFKVPLWIYGIEAVCNALVLAGIFTAEKHQLFYRAMEIQTDGMYHRIEVSGGILWRMHYIHMSAVILAILVFCAVRYRRSTPVQKKRILYIAAGIGTLALELVLKGLGVFGSYNPVVIAMTITMYCMMMAMLRYSYFGSLHAAVDNAFNHGNEGLMILDGDDTVVFVNQKMDELFPQISRGNTIEQYPEIRELLEGQEHLLRKDGVVYEMRTEDIIEQGGKNGCMLWLIDQTQALLTMQKLKEADEAKTQFLMKVSHELRTPMNTVLGMNEMILRESSEETVRDYAKEVADAGAHMLFLIDEVLDTSRLESGRVTISNSPYRICAVLKKAEELMRLQIESKGLEFIFEVEERLLDEKLCLLGDAAHLLQIIVNLLSNAVKYTDAGFVRLTVQTHDTGEGTKMLVSVSDSGIGIRSDELTKIFGSFERGSNVYDKDGMGLGLAIVKQLADAMQGQLDVTSAAGRGSTFTLKMPFIEAPAGETAKEAVVTGELPDLHANTILAVDDNKNNLMVLRHLLRHTRAAVETAADGEAAIEACRNKRYDLILLDHRMPGMDGIETLHEIRRDERNQDTPIIALTANAGKGAEKMYLDEGFTDYISKPVDPAGLERLLAEYLVCGHKEDEIIQEDSWLSMLKKQGVCTEEGLRYADMDEAFYRKLLMLFKDQYSMRKQRLEAVWKSLTEGDGLKPDETDRLWKEWISVCHGLKGEARGLGAKELGEYFYALELAGRAGDYNKIEEVRTAADAEWLRVVEAIQSAAAC